MSLISILVAILLVGGVSTAVVADGAKPGDALYKVDQAMEKVQEKLALTDSARANLIANLSLERAEELLALRQTDSNELTNQAQLLWEQHHQEAVQRLLGSIERLDAVMTQFRERLEATTQTQQKTALERVIAQMEEIKTRREARIQEIENREFPGQQNLSINQQLQEWKKAAQEEVAQIREEVKARFQAGQPDDATSDDEEEDDTDGAGSTNANQGKSNGNKSN